MRNGAGGLKLGLSVLIVCGCHQPSSNGSDAPRRTDTAPVDVLPDVLSDVPSLHVGAGLFFSCALAADGSGKCWGYGEPGTIGDGSFADATQPTPVVNLTGALGLSAQSYDVCVLAADHTAECWGDDFGGELGDNGSATKSAVPMRVGMVADVVQVSTGGAPICALHANTTVECWGGAVYNQDLRPALIPGFSGAVKLSPTSAGHTCAVMNDGSLRCWGRDNEGQLGDGRSGDLVKSDVPVPVAGLGAVSDVAVSYDNTCVLLMDQTVSCWGDNSKGQLGNGTTGALGLAPVAVMGLSNVVQLCTSDGYACATKSDGTAWCWGDNSFGELGNGTTMNASVPVQVSGLGNVAGIACGDEHACAQQMDGTVWCWGGNNSGGLGSATTTRCPQGPCSTTPIKVTL